jgi:hypothetical protein
MTIGWALLIVAVLYLIERHKLWRRTAQVAGVLLVLAALSVGVLIAVEAHQGTAERKRATAQNVPPEPVTLDFSKAPPTSYLINGNPAVAGEMGILGQ